ncbi:MAG: HEAT repeat domain-containing protein, partial [Planctomycetes bacterium]|nr:HEAT repeat domain-containing protein [Planctomycetota bacterium]
MSRVQDGLLPPRKTELETVVHWPTVAVGGGLALLFLGGPFVFFLFSPHSQTAAPAKTEQMATAPPVSPIHHAYPETREVVFQRLKGPETVALSAPGTFSKQATTVAPAAPSSLVKQPALPTPKAPAVAAAAAVQLPSPPAAPITEANAPFPHRPQWLEPSNEYVLLSLLSQAHEVDLDAVEGSSTKLLARAQEGERSGGQERRRPDPASSPLRDLVRQRPDLIGLPLQLEADCRMPPKAAENAKEVSFLLRRALRLARLTASHFSEPSYSEALAVQKQFRKALQDEKAKFQPEDVSLLVQMLQAEDSPVRLELVKVLTAIKGPEATRALAQRALFDLGEEVRQAALQALRERPAGEYRSVFLEGLRFPWVPVAARAAEALVALEDQAAVFDLVDLLDLPDPNGPVWDGEKHWVMPELVRVNHFRNCFLCHAPSLSRTDPLRGLVPELGKPIREEYYASNQGTFVRADVAYLRQDFSVLLPVAKSEPWPQEQRFDFLIRKRPLTSQELAARRLPAEGPSLDRETLLNYPQREVVLFAL